MSLRTLFARSALSTGAAVRVETLVDLRLSVRSVGVVSHVPCLSPTLSWMKDRMGSRWVGDPTLIGAALVALLVDGCGLGARPGLVDRREAASLARLVPR